MCHHINVCLSASSEIILSTYSSGYSWSIIVAYSNMFSSFYLPCILPCSRFDNSMQSSCIVSNSNHNFYKSELPHIAVYVSVPLATISSVELYFIDIRINFPPDAGRVSSSKVFERWFLCWTQLSFHLPIFWKQKIVTGAKYGEYGEWESNSILLLLNFPVAAMRE